MAEVIPFDATKPEGKCVYCGSAHEGYCPRIASISYYDDGTIEEIYFLPWWEWPENHERLMKQAMEHNAGVLAALQKHSSGGQEH